MTTEIFSALQNQGQIQEFLILHKINILPILLGKHLTVSETFKNGKNLFRNFIWSISDCYYNNFAFIF